MVSLLCSEFFSPPTPLFLTSRLLTSQLQARILASLLHGALSQRLPRPGDVALLKNLGVVISISKQCRGDSILHAMIAIMIYDILRNT